MKIYEKIAILLLIILTLGMISVSAAYITTYNPFTSKLDYVNDNNFAGNMTLNGTVTVLPPYNVSASWFKGAFDWLVGSSSAKYLTFNGTVLNFNETKMNNTIDLKLNTTYYNASVVTNITGTSEGVIGNIQTYDGVSYNVSEVGSDVDFRINFTGITDFNQVIIRYKSAASESHVLLVSIWDTATSSWESYTSLGETTDYHLVTLAVFDSTEHVSNGIVQVRLTTTNVGSSTHKWQFDWIGISKGPSTMSSSETDPYSIHADGNVPLTGDWKVGGYNINMSSANLTSVNYINPIGDELRIGGNLNITGNINAVKNITTDVHYFNTVTTNPGCTGCMYRNGTGLIIVG